jgi:hypothetical protein
MDTQRFLKIKSLSDLKYEKARLRYEILALEARLDENITTLRSVASFASLFSRVGFGFDLMQNAYYRVKWLFSKISSWTGKKKKKKSHPYPGNEYDYE